LGQVGWDLDEIVIYAADGYGYKGGAMISIQKLFAKDDRFFELLEASAEEGRASVQALKEVIKGGKVLDEFAVARQKEKQITVQISELLARTSVTVLDREDIEAISSVLYKIPKTVEKFAERYLISTAQVSGVNFSRQVVLLERATDTVVAMIRELEKSHFEQVNRHNEELQKAEGEADDLMLQLLKELYSGKYPPLTVTIVKDLYELLEKVVDRCRDVGNVVANVVLKHT
jgi:uncharacterized protein Yka (UPF0111/DUF47 family)